MELRGQNLGLSSKHKKMCPPQKFSVFQETELFDSKMKKLLIFSQNKAFLMFLKMEPCSF